MRLPQHPKPTPFPWYIGQPLFHSRHRRRLIRSRYGVRSRVTDEVRAYLLALVEAQADITIAELRDKIHTEKGVAISWTLTQNWVRRLGLRLKKSRSTPSSATLKPTVEDVPSFIGAS